MFAGERAAGAGRRNPERGAAGGHFQPWSGVRSELGVHILRDIKPGHLDSLTPRIGDDHRTCVWLLAEAGIMTGMRADPCRGVATGELPAVTALDRRPDGGSRLPQPATFDSRRACIRRLTNDPLCVSSPSAVRDPPATLEARKPCQMPVCGGRQVPPENVVQDQGSEPAAAESNPTAPALALRNCRRFRLVSARVLSRLCKDRCRVWACWRRSSRCASAM